MIFLEELKEYESRNVSRSDVLKLDFLTVSTETFWNTPIFPSSGDTRLTFSVLITEIYSRVLLSFS